MKALVVNALGAGFELESVDIATPIGREVLIDVKASGLCHTDLLFATHIVVPLPAVLGHEVSRDRRGGGSRRYAVKGRRSRRWLPHANLRHLRTVPIGP